MIGQKKLLSQIDNLIQKGFPRFVVITGRKGQGKTEVVNEISKRMKVPFCNIGIKIDEIREMIEMAYKQTEPIIYLIQNADKMSLGAKNSLLKVIEEPPQQAYFIMELNQIENTLETIKSRCQQLKMTYYNEEEISEMITQINPGVSLEERSILSKLQNYYQIKKVLDYDPVEFINYVDKVFNNIYKVQSANSFKLAEKIDLKDSGEGYDLDIFWICYINRCVKELFDLISSNTSECSKISECIEITIKYQQKLNITGINKQSLIDMWILDIRKVYR